MLAEGCTQCTLDQFGVPSTCLGCAENLNLNKIKNSCDFENCKEWSNENNYFE